MKTALIFGISLAFLGCEIPNDVAKTSSDKSKDAVKIIGIREKAATEPMTKLADKSTEKSTEKRVPRYRVLRIEHGD